MNATIQTSPQAQTGSLLDGYDEITRHEFEKMCQTFISFLRTTYIKGSLLAKAYVLAATKSIFLIQTTDNRFFVAHYA